VPEELRSVLTQFDAWCTALRSTKPILTIRYVNCDALTFCQVFWHQSSSNTRHASHWYRDGWNFDTQDLNSEDYGERATAHNSFDVIDTSNLLDHLGSLNVLAATVPLLSPVPSSILCTEMLVLGEENVTLSAKTLLSGDLPTMALLLGLKAVDKRDSNLALQ
jgi:hypothetical protein